MFGELAVALDSSSLRLRVAGPDGAPQPEGDLSAATAGSELRGGAVMSEGKVVGIFNGAPAADTVVVAPLQSLPEDLRPR